MQFRRIIFLALLIIFSLIERSEFGYGQFKWNDSRKLRIVKLNILAGFGCIM